MNNYHFRLLQKHLMIAMKRYVELCTQSPERHLSTFETVFSQTQEIVLHYIRLFKALGFLDQQPHNSHDGFLMTYQKGAEPPKPFCDHSEVIEAMDEAYQRFSEPGSEGLFYMPVQLSQIDTKTLEIFIGFVTTDDWFYTTTILFHQRIYPSLARSVLNKRFRYLAKLLDMYKPKVDGTLEEFVNSEGLSYQLVDEDSNFYFGCSFYQHYLKTKMIAVLEDLLFGTLNYKGITDKNAFDSYAQMYRLFHVRYDFPLRSVSRVRFGK